MNFFDKFKGDGDKKKDNKNPFANVGKALGGGGNRKFQGQGQSLGGSKPGKLMHIVLAEPGPLGMKIEKRPNGEGTAIVSQVIEGTQAHSAGLQRGDILCFAGSNGEDEIMYDVFIDLAKSPQRPLTFDIRRIETKTAPTTTSQSSADAYTRKQAMIAAAEAREKAAKARGKPVRKVANTKTAPPVDLNADIPDAPQSDAARLAVEAAKRGESHLAAQLGYNPYETNKATAGQARNATVTSQHGAVGSGAAAPTPLPSVTPPREATTAAKDDDSAMDNVPPVGDGFQLAFEEVITTNDHDNVVSSFGILRILIANATTKGQQEGEEATKFRRVRLSNAKIQAAIINMHGAVELMMSVGFELAEEEGESYLVYPPGDKGPAWLPRALQQMQQYETTSSL